MARMKLFISYSHRDQSWLDRLKSHLALLERNGVVHIWSDTRINIGALWQDEIDNALEEARVAVLIVSPDFLASEYIWRMEMPRIVEHAKEGLTILPLIARPCAWQLASELAELQAHPQNGRPLALGTEAEVDLSLAELVYELAARLQQLPEGLSEALASQEAHRMRTWHPAVSGMATRVPPPIKTGEEWIGEYAPTNRSFRLLVESQIGQQFGGRIVYRDDSSETVVEGEFLYVEANGPYQAVRDEARKRGIQGSDCIVKFRETRVVKPGPRPPELIGEYIGLLSGTKVAGIYKSNAKILGQFCLTRNPPSG